MRFGLATAMKIGVAANCAATEKMITPVIETS
jgi:hypothetical protein